jgi:hypothetical protein
MCPCTERALIVQGKARRDSSLSTVELQASLDSCFLVLCEVTCRCVNHIELGLAEFKALSITKHTRIQHFLVAYKFGCVFLKYSEQFDAQDDPFEIEARNITPFFKLKLHKP